MPKKNRKKKAVRIIDKKTAIAGFLVNLILPGVGTIILGKYDKGTIQTVLALAGLFFAITTMGVIIGIPLFIAIWIWAFSDGIKIIKKAE